MHQVFESRAEAGKQLAKKLSDYHESDAIIMAIPMGGVLVAAAAAHKLQIPWNVILSKKLPIPWNPEAGFGAITADGSIVLNEGMVHGLQLRKGQIDEVIEKVKSELIHAEYFFKKERPYANVAGKDVIVLDDGLASGYSMLAAIKSLRNQSAAKIIAAAPVASRSAAGMIEKVADKCVFDIVSPSVPFVIGDFYLMWRDLKNEDIIDILHE